MYKTCGSFEIARYPVSIQAVLIFATTMKLKEGAPSVSINTVELANNSHGEHRSREAGDGARCGGE